MLPQFLWEIYIIETLVQHFFRILHTVHGKYEEKNMRRLTISKVIWYISLTIIPNSVSMKKSDVMRKDQLSNGFLLKPRALTWLYTFSVRNKSKRYILWIFFNSKWQCWPVWNFCISLILLKNVDRFLRRWYWTDFTSCWFS